MPFRILFYPFCVKDRTLLHVLYHGGNSRPSIQSYSIFMAIVPSRSDINILW